EGPSWIAAAIQQKVQKHYAGVEGLNLLVYANFDALQMMHSEVVAACASNLSVFGSTWVLTSKHLCSLASSNSIGAVPGWRTIRSIQDYYLDE
ncbi:MAG TPA: hypothetical protein VM616_07015, partial [Gammaproteobacteria bacterium]|nr:hypothetical protein [Gammaproteobacteria bacterium]